MAKIKALTGFAAAFGAVAAAAGVDIAAPVLNGAVRTTHKIVQHDIETADRAADAAWLAVATEAQVKARQSALHAGMVAAVGELPKRVPLNAQVLRRHERDGYTIEEVMFESHSNVHVTALLFLPDAARFKAPHPGVIVTCGHSANGKAFAGYQRTSLLLAKAGIAALIYDPFDQGERIQAEGSSNTGGHNRIGVNATLVGWSMAGLRIWDGMRAIDYLQSRPEVDADRIGVCGQSGGGTMTSLIMAFDPRIKCAAPSCYLSTIRDVYGEIGPQDAEQNLFGQLSFGLNHLGYVLMQAPMPVLMNFKTADFFPLQGALETAANAKTVASRFGWADRFCHVYGIGPHGWSEGNRHSTVDWMRLWLRGETGVWDASGESYRTIDVGFDLAAVDCGIPENEVVVAPRGHVLNIPGERTVYDVFRAKLADGGSAPRKPGPSTVAARAGIRLLQDVAISPVQISAEGTTGGTVLMLDVSGTGEIATSPHKFYGAENPDEEVAVMLYALGKSLVGVRAEEMAFAASWLVRRFGGRADVIADGRVCVAAHHARGAVPELFGGIDDLNAPLSWRDVITGGERYPFACAVFGGLLDYDWSEL